jgi:two-component system, OmpR family, response regulator MprA
MVSPPTLPRPPRPTTVLIVEDNPDLRRIFADALFWAGFRVEQTDDGVTALRMIENDPPDVLVLDIGLPTLDGLSVRDELAANSETGDIPVVIVTGTEFTWQLRSDDRVLQKPVTPERLVATIRECLSAA